MKKKLVEFLGMKAGTPLSLIIGVSLLIVVSCFVYIMMTVFFDFLQRTYDKKQFYDLKMEIASLMEFDLNVLIPCSGAISLPLTQFVSRCWGVKQ